MHRMVSANDPLVWSSSKCLGAECRPSRPEAALPCLVLLSSAAVLSPSGDRAGAVAALSASHEWRSPPAARGCSRDGAGYRARNDAGGGVAFLMGFYLLKSVIESNI
jgi:hypothetical protein